MSLLPRRCIVLYRRNIFPIWALGLYRRLVLLGHGRLGGAAPAADGVGVAPGRSWLCAVSDFYESG